METKNIVSVAAWVYLIAVILVISATHSATTAHAWHQVPAVYYHHVAQHRIEVS